MTPTLRECDGFPLRPKIFSAAAKKFRGWFPALQMQGIPSKPLRILYKSAFELPAHTRLIETPYEKTLRTGNPGRSRVIHRLRPRHDR
jgi:hypothetical protein